MAAVADAFLRPGTERVDRSVVAGELQCNNARPIDAKLGLVRATRPPQSARPPANAANPIRYILRLERDVPMTSGCSIFIIAIHSKSQIK